MCVQRGVPQHFKVRNRHRIDLIVCGGACSHTLITHTHTHTPTIVCVTRACFLCVHIHCCATHLPASQPPLTQYGQRRVNGITQRVQHKRSFATYITTKGQTNVYPRTNQPMLQCLHNKYHNMRNMLFALQCVLRTSGRRATGSRSTFRIINYAL